MDSDFSTRLEGDQKVKGQNGICRPLALAGAALFGWAMMLAACSNQTAPGSETKLEAQPPSGSVEMHGNRCGDTTEIDVDVQRSLRRCGIQVSLICGITSGMSW